MKYFYRSLAAIPLILTLVFAPLSGVNTADASTSCTPTVKITKTKETSVILKVTCSALKSKKVSVGVSITNEDSSSTKSKTFSAKLGSSGSTSITVSSLDSATNYSFKAKVKKSGTSSYTSYSSSVSTTTKGSDYEPEIEKINGITEDSAKLKISCDDLDEEAVNVQVAYQKSGKSSWSTKTYSLTLDDDAEGSVTVTSLKSDTLYKFKFRIKKDDESSYSAYSAVKTATTDED
jgi:hypothetical protein